MARHSIQNLNYMTIGQDRLFINMDTTISYELSDKLNTLIYEDNKTGALYEDLSTGIRLIQPHDKRDTEETHRKFNSQRQKLNRTFEIEFKQEEDDKNKLVEVNSNQKKIGPLYDIIDVAIKSSSTNVKDNFKKFDNSITHSDIYVPQMTENPINFCQIKERTYMLGSPQIKCSDYLDCRYHPNSEYYDVNLCSFNYKTALYKKHDDLSVDGQTVSSLNQYFSGYSDNLQQFEQKIQDYFEPDRFIEHVEYNQLYTIPNDNSYKKNTLFDNGNIYAEIYTCKNEYDCNYSMSMSTDYELNGCREYVGLVPNGTNLYMKYVDGISYDQGGRKPNEKYGYQKIESFIPVEIRNQSESLHKSNIFSIRINNTGMSDVSMEGYDQEQKKKIDNIKNDIRQAVFQIAKNVAPVNTQLFDVYFED